MVANSSYSASAREIGELFADYLEGDDRCPVLVLGRKPAAGEGEVRDALAKSFEALGFGDDACAFAWLEGAGADMPAIDPDALFLLVEGLDPAYVVCVDKCAAQQAAAAYRTRLELDASVRIFGRPAAVFEDLAELLATERGKRVAWELFKTLPRN